MEIYVGVVQYGEYDSETTINHYVSLNKQDVVDALNKFQYPDYNSPDTENSWVEVWVDGKNISNEVVKEYGSDDGSPEIDEVSKKWLETV